MFYRLIAALLLLHFSTAVIAEENWALCATPVIKKTVSNNSLSTTPVFVEADLFESHTKDILTFTGNVHAQQGNQSIETEHLLYDKQLNVFQSDTQSIFSNSTSRITSSTLKFNHQSKAADFQNSEMQFLDSHRFVTARNITQINDDLQTLSDFSYSSCEPGDNAWALTSPDLELNHKTGLGSAKHVKLSFFDVPIFYFPYFQFPIDDKRHSGILMPSFSYSKTDGGAFSLPIYWNIDPQLDSTISLNYFSQRSLQVDTETRYLTQNSTGSLLSSNLDDEKENLRRYFYKLTHQSQFKPSLSLSAVLQEVSEQDFLSDFTSVSLATVPDYLPRHVQLSHQAEHWKTDLLFKQYQTLDLSTSIASRPYSQLPSLTHSGQFDFFDNQLRLNLKQNITSFDKDDSITGERYFLNPVFSSEWSNNYAFIKPKLSLFHSQYQITNIDSSREDFDLSLTTFSIDSGLFFERIASEENAWLQTLEPRLFYVKTPYKDQSHIPDFDSANLSVTYANLFKENRFSGYDRIGDSEHLTLGISSSLFSLNSGLELVRASIGQTFFLQDRQVQLSGTSISSESTSDLFAEFSVNFNQNLNLTSHLSQQAETDFINQKALQLSYKENDHVFNIGYRFKGEEDDIELEQTNVSFVYPINPKWKVFAKHQHSLVDEHYIEKLWGANYESCCWAFSILARESADDDFIEVDRSIYFQLTFKGLSNIGQKNNQLLQTSIPNYQP